MIYPPSQGSYYHLAKRLLGIEYVKRVEEDEDERDAEKNTGPVFRLLGGVAAVHLALSILQTLRRPPALPLSSSTSPSPHNSSVNESGTVNGHRCPLCLDAIGTRGVSIVVPVVVGLVSFCKLILQVATATPCGHLACWTCLLEGLKVTGECFVCR